MDVDALGGVAAALVHLHSDQKLGLTKAQAVANRAQYGENRLAQRTPRTFLSHLVEAFEDGTLKILVVSAVFSVCFGLFLSDDTADVVQGFAIVAAVVVVSGVNSFQNWSKDREFQSLAKIKADRPVQVLRDGTEVRWKSWGGEGGALRCAFRCRRDRRGADRAGRSRHPTPTPAQPNRPR